MHYNIFVLFYFLSNFPQSFHTSKCLEMKRKCVFFISSLNNQNIYILKHNTFYMEVKQYVIHT